MASDAPAASWSRSQLAGLVALALLVAALFAESYLTLLRAWNNDANYSHGYLVLPISIWLTYRLAQKHPLPTASGNLTLGGVLVVLGVFAHLGATVVPWPILDFPALALVLFGTAVGLGGGRWAAHFAFPIFFLFFMFPLPITWADYTSVWLQRLVGQISGLVLETCFVCRQQGNMITIAGAETPLYIAPECSGLRQLVAFLALGVLVSHLGGRGWGFSLLMALAAVPVAVLSNVLRVLVMAVSLRYLGLASISGWLHDVPALLTLPVGLGLFFLIHRTAGQLLAGPTTEEAAA